jgi:hypothetical protein
MPVMSQALRGARLELACDWPAHTFKAAGKDVASATAELQQALQTYKTVIEERAGQNVHRG